MSILALAERYAKALFEIAQKNKSSEKVEGDLEKLMAVISESPEFNSATNNPSISKANIEKITLELLKKLGADKLTTNFTSVLAQNGRIKYLSQIISAYKNLMMQSRDEKYAYITTATSLNDKQVADIEKTLGTISGHKIKALININPEILGGIIVRIGSKMLDASVAGQLERLTILNKKAITDLN